jgi:hypothetical protein
MTNINIIKNLAPAYDRHGFYVKYFANERPFCKFEHTTVDTTDYYSGYLFGSDRSLPTAYTMIIKDAPHEFKRANFITTYKAKKLARYFNCLTKWHDYD